MQYSRQIYSTTSNNETNRIEIKTLYFYKVLICLGENKTSESQHSNENKRGEIIWFYENCLTNVDNVEEMEIVSEYYKTRPKEFES